MRHLITTAATAAALALAACGSSAPAAFTLHGTVDVSGQLMISGQAGSTPWVADPSNGHCAASPPEQITAEGPSHQVLASGQLALGNLASNGDCLVTFALKGVPGGDAHYGVTVGTAGTVWFTAAQTAKPVRLTLSG